MYQHFGTSSFLFVHLKIQLFLVFRKKYLPLRVFRQDYCLQDAQRDLNNT